MKERRLTPAHFAAWQRANKDALAAKREEIAASREDEIAMRRESFTDATISAVMACMENGFSRAEACESLLANAFRFGACHEALNELASILESLGWKRGDPA